MIDFNDPGQVTHNGKRIPIDTPEKFDAAGQAARAVFRITGRAWDTDCQQQLEQRVRSGQDIDEIVAHTLEDRKARYNEV